MKIETDSVTFKIAYAKKLKKNERQKGKWYSIDNLKISRDDLAGIYIANKSKRHNKKISVFELAVFALIITGSLIAGPQ